MSAFWVTVSQLGKHPVSIFILDTDSVAAGMSAAHRFGGICGVSVKPAKGIQ